MLCDEQTATKIGQNVFRDYVVDGSFDINSLQKMLEDCYAKLELPMPSLTEQDLIQYAQIWDLNQDNSITEDDVENNAKQLLSQDQEDASKAQELLGYPPIQVTYESYVVQNLEFKEESAVIVSKDIKQETGSYSLKAAPESNRRNQSSIQQSTKTISNSKLQPLSQQSNTFVYPLETDKNKYQQYNTRTQKKLELAERVFNKFQKNGFITQNEAFALLKETYEQLKMPYSITEQDAKSWMLMADKDKDGKVRLQDFHQVLLDSLVQAGISIN
ncbi:unnamed protein product (macronuclear) [Paramecium tetraurelia]|uniref:Calcium-binding protein, putative n=3 Tax=Paramecium TaxID=5884 RepID=Q6BFU2_PARTE|nr:Calcium-binding protein [Paramecium tetraurelia strain d4-2]XP_001423186.1 uncharacterized protein GSPATT00000223001 [Paramecium tetraurelia]CAH03478.1 Calcium-binding protein, putative [Paramecium tetraurelia]CAK55788.1 unnamed protein product [Paramecium tetraurelia]|eukprot:XP_001423186.1 hypothetical protein (macronuclear) [Paramecium tetraurelia strain d4-2]